MPSHTKIDIVHGSVIRVLVLPACGLFAHELWRIDTVNGMIKCAQDKISEPGFCQGTGSHIYSTYVVTTICPTHKMIATMR